MHIAFGYLRFYKVRNTLIVLALAIVLYIPFGMQKLASLSRKVMTERAASTPLIAGTKGSSSDLVLSSLYFKNNHLDPLPYGIVDSINRFELGYAIPLLITNNARNHPVVGISLDYFSFKELTINSGRYFALPGECVIGYEVAARLNLAIDSTLISSPENYFDLAGNYPLKMKVTGVLNKSFGPDDYAVFVDIKTNWIMLGIGHGHENVDQIEDPTIVMQRENNVTKNRGQTQYIQRNNVG